MKGKKRLNGQSNRGFSLFAVIIAVSFIAILGLLVTYIAISNFYMKVTDLKGKDSFYTAEQGLEEIKVGLQQDVGTAMSKAFTEVMENYDRDSASGNAQDADRQEKYRELFIDYLKKTLKISEIPGQYDYKMFEDKQYLNKENVLTDESKETLMVVSDNPDVEYVDDKNNGIILKNLKVIYVDPKGRASIIKTDISLGTPKAKFPTSSTLPDLMSMVVVANGGIVCESPDNINTDNDSNVITLRGNIYAGLIQDDSLCRQINNRYGNSKADYGHKTSIWIKNGAQLNVESGEKFVSRAEINVDHSSLTINSKVGFWTRGITIGSSLDKQANVKLLGTSYVADDLTIASGSNAYVDIEGNYYGYGSEASAKELKTNPEYESLGCYEQYTDKTQQDSYSTSDLSSSIVINGKNATLDLSKVQKMELSGKSYISTSKYSSDNGTNSDVVTGESVTVKGSQLAYLAPSEILGNEFDVDGFTNPIEVTDENKDTISILTDEHVPVKWDEPVQAWGGKTLRDLAGLGIEFNQTDPVQKVFYPASGSGTYAYFYLNFATDSVNTNDTNASRYMQFYYQNNGDMKTKMDDYFSFYFNDINSGIKVNDEEAYVRYITNGNVLSYETKDKVHKGKLYAPVESNTSDALKNKSVVYRLMWYALNRKMVTNWDETYLNSKKPDPDSPSGSHNEAAYDRSVFDNLVNEPKMTAFLEQNYPNTDDGEKCVYPSAESGEMPKVIMCNNQGKNTLKITSDLQKDLRLVICTGDVEIEKNVQFQGIIMAKGSITLNSGSSLQASPIEAANVFQMQMGENSDLKPQDFFWDGDNYIRGNSTSDNDTTGKASSDVLDLSDYVFYQNWKKQ
ncbi:MAG: hypothetical protein ACLUSN_00350 [Blautia wexlerae]